MDRHGDDMWTILRNSTLIQKLRMEMGTRTQMLTVGSYPVPHTQTLLKLQSQEILRGILVLVLLRMRLLRLRPPQELSYPSRVHNPPDYYSE
jgi:hypothetical protein